MDFILHKEKNNTYSGFIIINDFLSKGEIDRYNTNLRTTYDWKTGELMGSSINRLQKWYHDDGSYFSKHWNNQNHKRWSSHKAEDWLLILRRNVQEQINNIFASVLPFDVLTSCNQPKLNSTLINYYRDGSDHIRYHSDDEKVFGDNPTIAILTFGCERQLKFKRINPDTNSKFSYDLNYTESELNHNFNVKPGSLFLMMGSVQKYYCHGIEKDHTITDSRYSITFREHK